MDEQMKMSYKMMIPKLKRTCLSAQSALSGRPNVADVPLGAKLPLIPGSCIVLSTASLGERLHQPSCDFDRTYPSDVYISNEYRCLHDPHLRQYFAHKSDVTKRLRKRKYITSDNKVVCSLKEYNLYRQYLKHLSIEYFNKILREKYEKELELNAEETAMLIEKKQQDPNNPITKRINRARKARNVMERALAQKRKKMIRICNEEREARCRNKEQEMRRRIREEIVREQKRERLKKVKMIHMEEERLLKEELLYYKHQEEIYRSRELEERKKAIAAERQRKLTEKYERKKRFHLMKMAELRQLLEEKEDDKKKNVEFWKSYFETKLNQQRRKLQAIMKQQAQMREAKNRKIEESLRARGWTGVKRLFPDQGKQETKFEKRVLKKKTKPCKPWGRDQLSSLGFHNAVVPEDLFELIWDQDLQESPESEDGEEHSSGDAMINPALKSLSDQAKAICEEIITDERARRLITEVIEMSQEMEKASHELVSEAVRISQEVLLPMLRTYEQRTGSKVPDSKVLSTLHELCSGILDEENDDLSPLIDTSQPGKPSIKAGRKESAIRFIMSNTDLPMGGLTSHRQQRPPTPKRRVQFDEFLDELNTTMESDSQLLLSETIKTLAGKVVDQVFESTTAPLVSKTDLQERVTDLASSVVHEIITIEEAVEVGAEFIDAGSITSSSSENSEEELERKISWLAKALVNGTVAKMSSSETSDSANVMSSWATQSDVSLLALNVVRSALSTVEPDTEVTIENSGNIYDQLEPLINELSSKLVDEVVRERQKRQGELLSQEDAIQLEEKLSKLALNIVESVLKGSAASPSASLSSMSSVTREAKVGEITVQIITAMMKLKKLMPQDLNINEQKPNSKESMAENVIGEVFNLKALHEAPNNVFKSLHENEIERIGKAIAKTVVPSRCASSAFSSGINELAIALTEEAVRGVAKESSASSEQSSVSVAKAVKHLADTLVKETLNKTSVISSGTESAISSGVDLLVDDLANEVLNKAEHLSDESAVSSGARKLAEELVSGAIEKGAELQSPTKSETRASSLLQEGFSSTTDTKTSSEPTSQSFATKSTELGSSTESALQSGTDLLASTLLQEAIRSATAIGSSSQSTLNSAIKDLSENVANMALDEALGKGSNSADSAISSLAAYVAKCAFGEKGTTTTSDLESALSSGVSKIIIDTLSSRVMEVIEQKSQSSFIKMNKENLKSDIVKIIRSLIDAQVSSTSQEESDKNTSEEKIPGILSSLTSSGNSEVSSAISALANNILEHSIAARKDEKSSSSKANNTTVATESEKKGNVVIKSKSQTYRRSPYESNFSWRSPDKDGVNGKDSRAIKVYGTQFNLNKKPVGKQGVLSQGRLPVLTEQASAEMQDALDQLACRIVQSVVAEKSDENSAESSDDVAKLSKTRSVEKLVESLALGVVTSLLGLNFPSSDDASIPDSTASSTTPLDDAKDASEEKLLAPSAGFLSHQSMISTRTLLSNLPRPSAPIPGRRHQNNDEDVEALSSILTQPRGVGKQRFERCEDNALTHPHRIPSPKPSKRSFAKSKRPFTFSS